MKKKSLFILFLIMTAILVVNFTGCGGGSRNLALLTSHELFETGKEKYEAKKYYSAIEMFQTIVYNYPGESIIDSAQYYLALSYFANEDYELAQVEFNRLVVNYPSSVYFEHGIFMKAVCFYEGTPSHYGLDQSDLAIATKQFEDFIVDFPESVLLEDAKNYHLLARSRMAQKFYSSAVVYDRIGAYKAAEIYFQKIIDDYTDTEFAPKSTFGLAEMEYKMKKYDIAREKFTDFMIVFPDHEFRIKAQELAEKAAYKDAEQAYEKGEFDSAREKFEAFKNEYPESDKIKKADNYIRKLSNLVTKE